MASLVRRYGGFASPSSWLPVSWLVWLGGVEGSVVLLSWLLVPWLICLSGAEGFVIPLSAAGYTARVTFVLFTTTWLPHVAGEGFSKRPIESTGFFPILILPSPVTHPPAYFIVATSGSSTSWPAC